MFPWSAVFSLEPKVPRQRSTEELDTNTLMQELGAMVKHTKRVRLAWATLSRRRRISSSNVNRSWLANTPSPLSYKLELQDLCAKVPPSQCGPLIVRFRKHVIQMEPEVPRLFHSVLRDCVDELSRCGGKLMQDTIFEKHQRSKSLSFVTFCSKF